MSRQFRVAGSNFTALEWNDGKQTHTLAHCNQFAHTSPDPVAQPVAIQPLDARRPIEIITPNAIGMGTLVLEIVEVYGQPIWEDLGYSSTTFSSAALQGISVTDGASNKVFGTDLADIFNYVASTPKPITVTKYVYPPAGSKVTKYKTQYHNCVISDFQDDETINIGTMQIYKNFTINYTHYKTTYPS